MSCPSVPWFICLSQGTRALETRVYMLQKGHKGGVESCNSRGGSEDPSLRTKRSWKPSIPERTMANRSLTPPSEFTLRKQRQLSWPSITQHHPHPSLYKLKAEGQGGRKVIRGWVVLKVEWKCFHVSWKSRERGAQAVEGGFGVAALCPSKRGRGRTEGWRGRMRVHDDASGTVPTRRSRGEDRQRGGVGACVCVRTHHTLSPLGRASRCAAPVGEDMAGTGAGWGQFSGCCKRSKTELRELNSSCKREQLGT